MVARRRQLLFYSNGIQLQRIPRNLLDRISDANMSVGRGGPIDREWPRWSAAGLANILDQTAEESFAEARENLRLYRNGAGHYADVVLTRDIIRLYQAGLGRYAPTRGPRSASESAQPALESAPSSPLVVEPATPTDVFSAPMSEAAERDLLTRSFAERMRTPLVAPAGPLPGSLTPDEILRKAPWYADLHERRGQSHRELRPGELQAPRVHNPLHYFDDSVQAVHWHERQRESAAQALREGQLHEPFSPSGTASYTFSSRGGSIDSIS